MLLTGYPVYLATFKLATSNLKDFRNKLNLIM